MKSTLLEINNYNQFQDNNNFMLKYLFDKNEPIKHDGFQKTCFKNSFKRSKHGCDTQKDCFVLY
jgi:hypothetical protein